MCVPYAFNRREISLSHELRIAGCLLGCLLFAITAEGQWSVEKLNASKGDWERMIDQPLRVEGRVSTVGKGSLRLTKCPLPFTIGDDQNKLIAGNRSLELTGKIQKDRDTSKLYFLVTSWRPMPTDAEEFRRRQAGLQTTAAKEWSELGNWARERGKFYEDDELEKLALSAFEKGIHADYQQTAKTPEALRALVTRAESLGLGGPQLMNYQFEAFQWEAEQLRKQKPPADVNWLGFAKRFRTQFAGTETVLPVPLPEWVKAARSLPVEEYAKADAKRRLQIHRLFYVDMLQRQILTEAFPDGRNGDEIAKNLDALTPEFKLEADRYRALFDDYRLQRLATSTRDDAQRLAIEFAERGMKEQSRQILVNWLKVREPQYRANGVQGLLQLADEFRTLLNDDPRAAALLMDAHKLDPTQPEASQRLQQLGYTLKGGKWQTATGQPVPEEVTPKQPAELATGITATQAKKILGSPNQIATVLTAEGTTQLWYYGKPGTSRLLIHLAKRGLDTESKVIGYASEK